MKKLSILLLFIIPIIAKEFTGTGTYVSESKRDACKVALSYAKEEAMQHAGTLMLSTFESSTSVSDTTVKNNRERKIKQFSAGMTKLKSKNESVKVDPDSFVFTCSVDAIFEIDDKRIKEFHEDLLEDERDRQKDIREEKNDARESDTELEKLKLQREIELLKLQQQKEKNNGSAQTYQQPTQQKSQVVYQEPQNKKSALGIDGNLALLYGDIQSVRYDFGVRFSQLRLFYGGGTDQVTYTGYYSADERVELEKYDYKYFGVEYDFSRKKTLINAVGLLVTTIDPNSISSVDDYAYYLASSSSADYYLGRQNDNNYLYNEKNSYSEIYWKIGGKYIQFIMAIQSGYEATLYRDTDSNLTQSDYYDDESIAGFKMGLNLTLPLDF